MDWLSIGDALWRIVLFGIVIGAGLPAVFALGLRALAPAQVMVTVGGEQVASGGSQSKPGPAGAGDAVLRRGDRFGRLRHLLRRGRRSLTVPLSKTLTAVLDWLRAGYPDGVTPTDYFPLLALLTRQLSTADVREIAQTLMDEGDDVTKVDIGVAVTKITHELPSEDDIRRVAARLAAAGYPTPDSHS